MVFNEEIYLIAFLLGVMIVYTIVPKKIRWIVLLLSSYLFFFTWVKSKWVILYLIGTTLFTYLTAVWIKHLQNRCDTKVSSVEKKEAKLIKKQFKSKEKAILIVGIVVLILSLLYTHYTEFILSNINDLLLKMGILSGDGISDTIKNILPMDKVGNKLVPIGISFYTMEAIGYIVDVYWGKVKVDKHPFKLALFLSFFPQLVEGPIAMYSQTADQLWEGKSIKIENIKKGYIRIFWGLLKLGLVSLRLSPLVKQLFNNYEQYDGAVIILAAVAYTAYLYMDFSGSIDICIGSAQIFGIELPENFRQPFCSKGASEFWQRWHITLGVWFKTYIFYPASVSKGVKKWNKFAKKKLSKNIAKIGVTAMCLFPVWMCNGLWHGPQWTFIFYGIYYFVILLLESIFEPVRKGFLKKTKLKEEGFVWKTFLTIKTLIIIFTGELFFNAKSLKAGFQMFFSIFRNFNISRLFDINYLQMLGTDNVIIDKASYISVLLGIVIVAIYGALKERGKVSYEKIASLKTPIRWAIFYALILIVLLLGAYGVGYDEVDLIYANF